MELLNATKMKAGYTMGLRPDGRELLVVVVKGTFGIPKPGEEPKLAQQQADLVMADEFTGEPGFSAPKYESDFPPVKPRCDVLLNGAAYAPGGQPATRVQVGLGVGGLTKMFSVLGNRVWEKGLLSVSATSGEPFVKMPFSYGQAFGGVDKSDPDEKKHRAFVANPVGQGFHSNHAREAIHGKPLPNTEELDRAVKKADGDYRPMSFGPIGRAWPPRPQFAGTYDQDWQDNVFPFLPKDIDERYYQAAPADQQTDYLKGGEEVVLLNLTHQGRTSFKLPTIDVPVTFYLKNSQQNGTAAVADTLIIEPELDRFVIVWRASLPLRKNMFEVAQVLVGRMPRSWYRARELGKTWYPSLKAIVDAHKAQREEAVAETEEAAQTPEPEDTQSTSAP
jgi:hypothetical protein